MEIYPICAGERIIDTWYTDFATMEGSVKNDESNKTSIQKRQNKYQINSESCKVCKKKEK